MPELCRMGSLVIRLIVDDHNWPHVHVEYAENQALLRIHDLAIYEGNLPPAQRRRLLKWARLHHRELREAWERAERREEVRPIEPLPGW